MWRQALPRLVQVTKMYCSGVRLPTAISTLTIACLLPAQLLDPKLLPFVLGQLDGEWANTQAAVLQIPASCLQHLLEVLAAGGCLCACGTQRTGQHDLEVRCYGEVSDQ